MSSDQLHANTSPARSTVEYEITQLNTYANAYADAVKVFFSNVKIISSGHSMLISTYSVNAFTCVYAEFQLGILVRRQTAFAGKFVLKIARTTCKYYYFVFKIFFSSK